MKDPSIFPHCAWQSYRAPAHEPTLFAAFTSPSPFLLSPSIWGKNQELVFLTRFPRISLNHCFQQWFGLGRSVLGTVFHLMRSLAASLASTHQVPAHSLPVLTSKNTPQTFQMPLGGRTPPREKNRFLEIHRILAITKFCGPRGGKHASKVHLCPAECHFVVFNLSVQKGQKNIQKDSFWGWS